MKIEKRSIKIKDLANGFKDNEENGVVAYGGRLDIRPPYQREFVYNEKLRNAVIDTVQKGFPLSVMYWSVREEGSFEIIDGQQRTISICQYINGDFSINGNFFHSLPNDKKEQILNYELDVYQCSVVDSERLEWFERINIPGLYLTKQELRSAHYNGKWNHDSRKYFCKKGCAAYQIAGDYLSGSAIRQDYLETVLNWISKGDIKNYMSKHQYDANANELRIYFRDVIDWIERTFPNKRKNIMKGVDWGTLYNQFKNARLNPVMLEKKIKELILDDDIKKKSGIYPYVLTGEEKHLSVRSFSISVKLKTFEEQNGICPICNKKFDLYEMEADHITPWAYGGKTIPENCQMLCRNCNRQKSNS